MKMSILSFSEQGSRLGQKLSSELLHRGWQVQLSRCSGGGLAQWTQEHFAADDAIIFIGSCGIAVRAIAPHVKSKLSDPAVVVIDELGCFAVSLLSGHLGGANRLTEQVAQISGATAVITTATDRHHIFAVDTWAKAQGLHIANPQQIKSVSAALLAGKQLRLKSDFPLTGRLPQGIIRSGQDCELCISIYRCADSSVLQLVPPILSLGIGCKKGIREEDLECAFQTLLSRLGLHPAAIAQVCSIDLKAQEPGLLAFCQKHELALRTYTAQQLMAVPGEFSSSQFVKSVTGVDNVCERSAVLASTPQGTLLQRKTVFGGITMALAAAPCTLSFEE